MKTRAQFLSGKFIVFNDRIYAFTNFNCDVFSQSDIEANNLAYIISVHDCLEPRLEPQYIKISILLKNKVYWTKFGITSHISKYSKIF